MHFLEPKPAEPTIQPPANGDTDTNNIQPDMNPSPPTDETPPPQSPPKYDHDGFIWSD